MIIVIIKGGLGNQMFEYATAFAMAKMRNEELYLLYPKGNKKGSLFCFQLDKFKLSKGMFADIGKINYLVRQIVKNRFARKIIEKLKKEFIDFGKWRYIPQTTSRILDDIVDTSHNIILDGYWQNPKNFKNCIDLIYEEFTPNFTLSDDFKKWKEKIFSIEESVSVHIRRGDYLKKENVQYRVKEEYYDVAINYIKNIHSNAGFFVFSDDKEWAKQNFPDFEIVEVKSENEAIEEMILISCCKNNINANSTFSWWGAMLNRNEKKIVVSPDRVWNPEIIPSEWVVVKHCMVNDKDELSI